jgi:hypothetical protein
VLLNLLALGVSKPRDYAMLTRLMGLQSDYTKAKGLPMLQDQILPVASATKGMFGHLCNGKHPSQSRTESSQSRPR